LHTGLDKYEDLFRKACSQIQESDVGSGPDVVFVSLKNPRDQGLSKSGDFMGYLARAEFPRIDVFRDKKPHSYNDADAFREAPISADATVVLVDDYIGTGDTAVSVCRQLVECPWGGDKLIVLTLVSLETGWRAVQNLGVPVYAAVLRKRAISDSARFEDAELARFQMRNIEGRLGLAPELYLGYKQSEGLEAMLRTPDNTLPVFWTPVAGDRSEWPAPFLRA
jgi:hypothetical protein